MTQYNPVYKRIILKMSGEALAGEDGASGISPTAVGVIAERIEQIHQLGVQIGLVIGGGNFWRGAIGASWGMEQSTADHIGMIATVMNGLALQDALERRGVTTRVQTAIAMNQIAEPYIRLRAVRHMEKGRVVIIAGGTGNPYFTTDTAAALRALEIDAEIVVKATKVNGIYTADPKKDPTATRYATLSYDQVIAQNLGVMDMTAFTMCREKGMPILVVNFWSPTDLLEAICGRTEVGTLVTANG